MKKSLKKVQNPQTLNLGNKSHYQSKINFRQPKNQLIVEKPKTSNAVLGESQIESKQKLESNLKSEDDLNYNNLNYSIGSMILANLVA